MEPRLKLTELIETLKLEDDAEMIQNAVFSAAKKHNLTPADLFKTLYSILIGTNQGPRLGPYILAMGKRNVIDALGRALKT